MGFFKDTKSNIFFKVFLNKTIQCLPLKKITIFVASEYPKSHLPMKNLHQSNNFYCIFSLAKIVRSLGKPFNKMANQWRNITCRLRIFFHTKNWYDDKLVTHLFLIFFFPIGLYALWKSHTITKWWKISASLLLAFLLTSIGFGFLGIKKENIESHKKTGLKSCF